METKSTKKCVFQKTYCESTISQKEYCIIDIIYRCKTRASSI